MIDELIQADIAYHLELSVRLAASGETNEAASEAALALALLSVHAAQPVGGRWSDLPEPAAIVPDGEMAAAIHDRAHALALEIEAHYLSEGRHELATAYESAATWLTGR